MEEVGIVKTFNNFSFIEWEIRSFSELPNGNEKIWSPSFGRRDEIFRPDSRRPCFASSFAATVILRSAERGIHPGKVIIGVIENITRNTESKDTLIASGIAEWTPVYEGYTAPSLLPLNVLYQEHPAANSQDVQGSLRLFCQLADSGNEHTHATCSISTGCLNAASNDLDEVQRISLKSLSKTGNTLKEMYRNAVDTDLEIKVKGQVFKAHAAILRARSTVFDAMMSHDCTERNNHVIVIEDIEPRIFHLFLLYLYSGDLENDSLPIAYDLYYAADKYDVQELKEMCAYIIKINLSSETVVDAFRLAQLFNDESLYHFTLCFFRRHVDEIMESSEWKAFYTDNPEMANEIHTKSSAV